MLGKGNIKRVEQINARLQRPSDNQQTPRVSKRIKDKRKAQDRNRSQQRARARDRKMENFNLHAGFELNKIFDVSSSQIEDLLFLVTGICSTTSVTSAVVHVLAYIKSHYKGVALTEYVINFVQIFFEEYFARLEKSPHVIDDFFNCDASASSYELHAGIERDFFANLMESLKSAQENWAVFKEGPYFKHLMCLISFVSTIGFFPSKLQVGDLSLDLFKVFHLKALDLQGEALNIFEALFSTVFFFVSRGFAIFKGNDHNLLDSDVDQMDNEYAIIVGAENLVSSGKVYLLDEGVEPRIKSRYEYDMRLQQLITKMSYYKKLESNNFARKVYDDKIVRLHKIKFELLRSQNENHFRECPYSFMISGSSSIGKSTLNSILITSIADANGIEAGEGYKVVVNEQDKYDSDIKPHTTIITLDDFGNMKPDKVEDPPTRRIIDLINNMTKTAVKADVNEKGSVTINPKIVTITTNTSDLHANFFSVEPVAIMRRINVVIVPRLRPSHTDEYGGLRSDMFVQDKDAWLFDLYKIKIELATQGNPMHRNPDKYKYIELAKDICIFDLLDLVKKDSMAHFAIQRSIVTSYRENINKVCVACSYPKLVCKCTPEEIQCEQLLKKMEKHSGFQSPIIALLYSMRILTMRFFLALMLFFANVRYQHSIAYHQPNSLLVLLHKANHDARTLSYYYDRYSKFTFKSVYQKIWENAAILVLGSAAVSAYLIYRKCKAPFKACTQGAVESVPSVPNYWKKPEFIELPRSVSSVGVTSEQLVQIVSNAIAVLRIYDPVKKGSIVCNIIPLRGNYWLAPSHMFDGDRQHEVSISYSGADRLAPVHTGAVSPACWRRIPGTDFIILQMVFAGDQPNLLKFFSNEVYLRDKMALDYIYRDFRDKTQVAHKEEAFVISDPSDMEIKGNIYHGCIYRTSIETFNGLCMATFMTKAHSPMIVGFHLAGHGNQGVIVPVSSVVVKNILKEMATVGFDVHSSGSIEMNLYNVDYKFSKKVHFRSPVNYLTNENGIAPSLRVYGSHELGRTNYNSAVVRTFISHDIEHMMGVPCKHGPPPLKNLKYFWHQDLDRISHDTVYIDHAIFQLAVTDFREYIERQYDVDEISKLMPLTLDESVAGIDGKYGIDSLCLTTSMGFPLNCPKKKYLVPSDREVEGISRPLDVPLFLRQHIEECEARYSIGERCYPILKTTMKDEPTIIGKQKRRLFQASPCWFIILVRKYFLPVGAYIQQNRLKYCTAVGANAHGKDWDDIAMHLTRFGSNKYIAGDYKAFDKKMPAILLRTAGQVFIDIARLSGNYSDRHLYIMQGLLTDLIYPVLEYDGVFISVTSSHCSGNSLTVLLNNFANMLYMRMAYYSIYRDKGIVHLAPVFSDRVNLLVYGDDNVAEIHCDETHFNHTTCAQAMAKFGVEYTMADKEQESIPYVSIHDISFLKRRFRFETDLCRFVAPLEVDSIFKSLHCMMRQRSMEMCEREIVAGNIRSAFLEFWLHGRDYYDIVAPQLWQIVVKHKLEALVGDYATYDQHLINYTEKYGSDLVLESDEESSCDDFLYELQSGFCDCVRSHSCERLLAVFIERPSDNVVILTTLVFYYEYIIHNYPNNNKCLCTTKSILHSETTTIVWSGKVNPQDFQLQSGREIFTIVSNNTKYQNVSYNAASPGYKSMMVDTIEDSTFQTVTEENNSIAEFLSRPVLVRAEVLAVGASFEGFTTNFNPWSTFLNTASVVSKIKNFNMVRGTMHLRFEINGTPFQYGKIMVTYDAYEEFTTGTILRADLSGERSRVIPSQRMKVILDPSSSVGAEMILPFFYDREFIELHPLTNDTAVSMGLIRIWSLAPFGNTNGSADPLNLKVYAWMENVTLVVPTFYPQAGYETGLISKPATAVAAAARAMANIPLISSYMKATEYAAGAVAKIAGLFGYSKPTIVADETRIVRFASSNMATGNGVDSVYKLAMDGKNELTVDPRVVGLGGKDEMAIVNIASIESYLCNVPWNTQSYGTCLASFNVTPIQYRVTGSEGPPRWYMSASATVGQAFSYWKGSTKFRFVISSSNFHRGRLKIVWEPKNSNLPFDPILNTNYSHVVDLADTSDFTICVGWGQTRMYRRCVTMSTSEQFALSANSPNNPDFSNGKLYVYVLNPLMSSSADTPSVQISVFTSMCDDVEFAGPTTGAISLFTPFSLQSGFELHAGADGDPTSTDTPTEQPYDPGELVQMSDDCFTDNVNLVYFGERVTSIRTVIKRYVFITSESGILSPNSWNTFNFVRWCLMGIPGPDSTGMHLATGNIRWNYVRWSYLNWFRLCYAGWRGSVRYKVSITTPGGPQGSRGPYSAFPQRARVTNEAVAYTQPFSIHSSLVGNAMAGGRGAVVSHTLDTNRLDFELPYIYNRRMSPGGRTNMVASDEENFSVNGFLCSSGSGNNPSVTADYYQAAGEDMSFHYWMGPPIMYLNPGTAAIATNPFPIP